MRFLNDKKLEFILLLIRIIEVFERGLDRIFFVYKFGKGERGFEVMRV